jgi:hypothetical protein
VVSTTNFDPVDRRLTGNEVDYTGKSSVKTWDYRWENRVEDESGELYVVSLNSDSAELARRLYWDAAKAVKYGGVDETEALKMVTLNAALQLGIDKRVGTIEVGKDADLAVFKAHPFSPDTLCEMTLVDGVVYFDRAKDQAARSATVAAGGAR